MGAVCALRSAGPCVPPPLFAQRERAGRCCHPTRYPLAKSARPRAAVEGLQKSVQASRLLDREEAKATTASGFGNEVRACCAGQRPLENPYVCDFDQALEERGWRDGDRIRSDCCSDRGCRRDCVGHGRHQPDFDVLERRDEAVTSPSFVTATPGGTTAAGRFLLLLPPKSPCVPMPVRRC